MESLETGIAPSPRVDFGLSVIAATTSYAGSPVPLRRRGAGASGVGLAETRRWTVGPPGGLPLRRILFALADAPDLRLAPVAWPELRNVWTGAGPSPGWALWLLTVLARLRSCGQAPSLKPLVGIFHAVINRLHGGEHRGGMIVQARGMQAGKAVGASWHLLAEGDDGPFIPAMAAAVVIGRMRAGKRPAPGARAATAELELSDFQPFFDARAITTGAWSALDSTAPVFRQVLGGAFERLPPEVRALHAGRSDETWAGTASVERGEGWLVVLICAAIGLPAAAAETQVNVRIARKPGKETWRRTFGGRSFTSVLTVGRDARERLICERFGVMTVAMALVLKDRVLEFVVRDWSVLGVPMPRAVAPLSTSHEREEAGRFVFDVEIGLPLIGRLVRYRGWLEPRS